MQSGTRHLNRLLGLFSIGVFLLFLFYRVVFIFYPHTNAAGIDNNVVYFIQRLLDGGQLYTNPAIEPFSIAQYSPLYYYATAGICKLSATGADDVLRIFEISKAFCLFLNLVLAGVIFKIALRVFLLETKKCWFISFLTFIFIESNSYGRADSMEHLFFFLSLYFFFLAVKKSDDGSHGIAEIIGSAAIAVLAFLSKQSAVTLPVICALWLLKKRQGRMNFYIYTATYCFTLVAALLILQSLNNEKAVFQNIFLGLDNGVDFGSYWLGIILNFYGRYGYIWVISSVVIYFLLQKEKTRVLRFLAFSLLLQFLLSNLFAFKYGAAPNYFTHWWTLLFLGFGIYWDRASFALEKINKRTAFLILIFFLGLKATLTLQPTVEKLRTMEERRIFFNEEKELAQHILTQKDAGKRFLVFCNLFSPDSYLNNILFREAIVPQYDVTIVCYSRKVYNYEALRTMLTDGSVKVIVTRGQIRPLKFMDIDLRHYVLNETIGEYNIYLYSKPMSKL